VRGLVFDMPNVLYDATLWRRWLWRLLGRLGISREYAELYRPWDAEFLPEVQCGRRDYCEALQAFLLATGLSWAQIDEVEAASRIHGHELEAGERPLPGTAQALGRLSAMGIRLAILTDSPFSSATLSEKLDGLGLGHCFEAVLSSFDLEVTLPAPSSYKAAACALDLHAGELAYIGHQTPHLAGAAAAGWLTVAFNHERDARAELHITNLADLLAAPWLAGRG